MESNLVIKVKYGDMLRRFSVIVNDNGSLDIGIAGLTAKICSLFKFTSVDDITLTYIDEDKDIVTLVDDDDLRDVIKQRLNPLRINVLTKTSRGETFHATSSGWSTPSSSQQLHSNPLSHINSGINEVLKSLPEPVSDLLSKLSSELASKAVSSAPVLADIGERLAKLGLHPGVTVSQSDGNESDVSADNKVNEGPEASKNSSSAQDVLVDPDETSNSKQNDNGSLTKGFGTSNPATTTFAYLPKNSNGFGDSTMDSPPPFDLTSDHLLWTKKGKDADLTVKTVAAGPSASSAPLDPLVPLSRTSSKAPLAAALGSPNIKSFSSCGDKREQLASGIGQSSASNHDFNSDVSSPISGVSEGKSSEALPDGVYWGVQPFRRSYSHFDSMGRIFHMGVRCDGCGVHPITGPRFKSQVRGNYDLCSICFSELGNEAEYTRIEHPISYRCPRFRPIPHSSRTFMLRGNPRPRMLHSCFIQDVNIPDGTLVAPSTPFTKIWRMRNNGTVPWPCGTQLVCVGGYQFTTTGSDYVQIPGDGCPVGKDIDIAVDFTAPAPPGRYISYWMMMSPSGEKFGQRIWVLIQVDTTLNSLPENLNPLNLNLPPGCSDEPKNQIIDMNIVPVDVEDPKPVQSDKNAESMKPMVNELMKDKELVLDSPRNDGLSSINSVPISPEAALAPPLSSYPAVDSSVVQPPLPVVSDAQTVHRGVNDSNNMVEVMLLQELEEMGFKQIELNKEILRLNKYNLEQSVDDLCGVSDWDPILEELQEMGFPDREINKRLLIKNGGSIKRVVMDLIAEEST